MAEPLERLTAALADRYRFERELGAGGMATVYLAEDLKHHRKVAIKVLHPELAAVIGTDRFLAEIQVTAHLQHPNILPLFESGSTDGLVYYVMPYVEGESLRDRLTRERQLPVDDVVQIGQAVAGALAYAHRHGVIHRDIKPENILLLDGQPLVADFGIALAVRTAGGARLTQTGLSLGTPADMSPEQASGDRDLDGRSDVYSLGAVLYECVAGEAPFAAASTQAIIARLLSEEPKPLGTLRKTVPHGVEAAVHKALAKLPADRFAGAGSFADALRAGLTSGETRQMLAKPAPGQGGRLGIAAIAVGALAGGAIGGYLLGAARAPARSTYDVGMPDSLPIAFAKGGAWGEGWRAVAVSPAGDFLLYIADRGRTTELWQRSLTDLSARPVPGTEGVTQFYPSPDGQSVALFAGAEGKIVSLADQAVTAIGRFSRVTGATWSSGTRVIVAELEGTRLVSVDMQSGTRDTTRNGSGCYLPKMLGSSSAMVCSGAVGGRMGVIHVVRDGRSENVSGLSGSLWGSDAQWLDGKYLLWVSPQGDLMASSWDGPGTRAGPAARMLSGLRTEGISNAAQYGISAGGTLVYAPGEKATVGQLVATTGQEPVDTLPVPRAVVNQFDFSRDGRRLAATIRVAEGDELWVYDLTSGRGDRWLSGARIDEPRWSPDGRQLLATTFVIATGESRTVVGTPGANALPDTVRGAAFYASQWVRDDLIIGHVTPPSSGTFSDIILAHLTGDSVRVDTLRSPGEQTRATLSPDGHWLAFMSDDDVMIEDYPGRTRRITVGRGLDPLWSATGELVRRDGSTWHWVRVDPVSGEPRGESRPAWKDTHFIDTPLRSQALMADGRVAYVRGSGKSTGSYVRVIPDWVSQMRKAVAAAGR